MEPKRADKERKPYFDQRAIGYTPSQLAPSHAGSISGTGKAGMNNEEDVQSKASFYTSYTATTGEDRLVRKESGREFNVLNETYSLPTDVNEWDRLDKQHRALTLGLGGLYPAPEVIRAILAPEEGVLKRIVDLGCGTGIWTSEMAREYPHCEVLGVDLAPVPLPPAGIPPNCRFEMDDVNLGLHHLRGQFDIVFTRAIGLGLKDFRKSLADMEACLKPGGMLIWVDGDYDFQSGWPMVYRPFWSTLNPNGSFAQRVLYEVRRLATLLRGSDVKNMEKIIDEGFWDNATMLDPDTEFIPTNRQFKPEEEIIYSYLYAGTWCDEGEPSQREQLRYVGMLMRADVIEFSRTTEQFLIKSGWPKETVDHWGAGMRDECQRDTLGLRVRLAWGRRRAGPNLPAPPLPEVTQSAKEGSQPVTKYPFYEVYNTSEQALAQIALRNRGKDIPEPPLASQSA